MRQLINKHKKSFSKYALVGLSGVVINEFFLFFFTEIAGFFFIVSSLIAIEISIISNFTWNEKWTFKDRVDSHRTFPKRLVKFNIVSAVGIILNVSVLYLVTTTFGFYYLISNLFGILAAMLWNYLVNFYWTWRTKV